jgi:hypothetical protein
MPYISLNDDLVTAFADRLPEKERKPYFSIAEDLRKASTKHRSWWRAWLEKHSALYHYAPFFRYYVNEIPGLKLPNGNYNFSGQFLIGRKSLYAPVPAQSPAGIVSLGIAPQDYDARTFAMVRSAIDFLREKNVKVILYLKPHGPNEWKSFYEAESNPNARQFADDLCAGGICLVDDERWTISGTQFTDTTAHYTPEANKLVGEHLAAAIRKVLAQ